MDKYYENIIDHNAELEQKLDEEYLKTTKLAMANNRLENILKVIKIHCNETIQTMNNDASTNPYAQGRCIEAKKVLEIIGGDNDTI